MKVKGLRNYYFIIGVRSPRYSLSSRLVGPGIPLQKNRISLPPSGVEFFGLTALSLSNLHETKYEGDIISITH
jgi:predicted metallo-beta-lactamase superfamily hydrolase